MSTSERKQVAIYTDGACTENPGPGGYAAILISGKNSREVFQGYQLTTNNRMELWAAIAGLEALKYPCDVTIYADSQLLVDAAMKGWIAKWKSYGWKRRKKSLLNADLWQRLLVQIQHHAVDFVCIKDYAGIKENERAKQLVVMAKSQKNLVIDEAYENNATTVEEPEANNGDVQTVGNSATHRAKKQDRTEVEEKVERIGSTIQVTYQQRRYVWSDNEWYDAQSFTDPPSSIVRRLNAIIAEALKNEDAVVSNMAELIQRAVEARDALQYDRSEKLARRVLAIEPDNRIALAVLCATLRAKGQPLQALEATAPYASLPHPPLITSRAAALCDLKRWSDAKRTIGRALAIGGSDEAFMVVERIKSKAPRLYKSKKESV